MTKYYLLLFIIILNLFLFNTYIVSKAEILEDKIVYLTFDDGPSKNTTKIIKILDDYNIKGTFFLVGNRINSKTEAVLRKLNNEKHYIGMHTMSHDYDYLYRHKNASKNFINEIIEEQKLIFKITGLESTLLRPPYSDGKIFSNAYIEDIINLNIKQWDWNVDTIDWKAKSVNEILNNIDASIRLLRNESTLVILFHEFDLSVKALPVVIERFKQDGYRFEVYDPKNHFPHNFKNNPYI